MKVNKITASLDAINNNDYWSLPVVVKKSSLKKCVRATG
jgi:hypothetical protein